MKHFCTRILLAALMSMAGANAFAYYDFKAENSQGVIIYYNYINDGRELEVSWGDERYKGVVDIPEEVTYMNRTRKVTAIGEAAFQGCSELTSVTMPKSITTIGSMAFQKCRLTSITIPESVTTISRSAFSFCSRITSINIPNSVTAIGPRAFSVCSKLTSVTIGNSITEIPIHCFSDCRELPSVVIPNNVTSIGPSAFESCNNLTSVTIGNNVKSIGNNAFWYTNLTSVVIPNSVETIGSDAFLECSELKSVTIGNGVKKIDMYAFRKCSNLSSVHISDLAAWCNIHFGGTESNPLSYAHHLYMNGQEIKDLVIPEGVTKIGYLAFYECTGINTLTIPSSVKSIGNNAFYKVDLTTVVSRVDTPFNINGKEIESDRTFGINTYNNATLYVPAGTAEKYKATRGWKDFIFIEEQ